MIGPAPTIGGGLYAPGGGGGYFDPSTESTDPATPPLSCDGVIGSYSSVSGDGGLAPFSDQGMYQPVGPVECAPPPGGPAPSPSPTSGSPVTVTTKAGALFVTDLMVTCVETGVTLTLSCTGAVFFGNSLNNTYTSVRGPGTLCTMGGATSTFESASVTNHGTSAVTIVL